ncbi:MAG: transglutaminase family protein, partial [Planctomycetota bacterium]
IPARYVIGYLHADGDIADASHAWAELYVENLGWVGFDAANGKSPDAHYIRLGSGFDAVDAAPIRGVAQGSGAEAMEIDVRVVKAGQ